MSEGFLSIDEVTRRTSRSDRTVRAWVTAGLFPKPVKFNGRNFWSRDAVAQWERDVLSGNCTAARIERTEAA